MKDIGIKCDNVTMDFDKLQESKDKAVTGLTSGIEFLLKKNKVDYLKGWGKFNSANGVDIDIEVIDSEHIEVFCRVTIEGKTGVEMEALTGANITCLTIYDMCKSISQKMIIKEVKLLEKTGGRSDIKN